MELVARFWATVTYVISFLTFSELRPGDIAQHPLGHFPHHDVISSAAPALATDHPHFRPPSGDPEDDGFRCDYKDMVDWFPCSTPNNRGCWLRHANGSEIGIDTNYEIVAPIGIDRFYELNITDTWLNTDGMNFTEAKVFNDIYPGPWIQACWGDRLHITVRNNLKHNGTSIHWHGLRQLRSMEMDGVNGVTQCPIAPGDSMTYSFNTTQYGSSWYHSHYSVQYADGLQGPITIHGPSSANYHEAKDPIVLTDWGHTSAFNAVYANALFEPSILLNGRGDVSRWNNDVTPPLKVPDRYEIHFEQIPNEHPKKYLLRIINTSFDTTFIFSIDNHWLQMASADFVPIEPYYNTSLLIGIGQRYNVIVEALPQAGPDNPLPAENNFWIRTWTAQNCPRISGDPGYELNGILRYDSASASLPQSLEWPNIAKKCSDEAASSLKPKLPWYVGKNVNGQNGDEFILRGNQPKTDIFPLAFFAFEINHETTHSLQINYSDPIFQHLDENREWPPQWAVVPANYTEEDWVYLVLTSNGSAGAGSFGAHPLHLHGHDFAILQQHEGDRYSPELLNLTLNNPARRDVVLLPTNGFVVIAFKSDNPGNWLLHCHIAFHASEGLGFQVLERQADAAALWPLGGEVQNETEKTCKKWDDWYGDCNNWWAGCPGQETGTHVFQDDSGI